MRGLHVDASSSSTGPLEMKSSGDVGSANMPCCEHGLYLVLVICLTVGSFRSVDSCDLLFQCRVPFCRLGQNLQGSVPERIPNP